METLTTSRLAFYNLSEAQNNRNFGHVNSVLPCSCRAKLSRPEPEGGDDACDLRREPRQQGQPQGGEQQFSQLPEEHLLTDTFHTHNCHNSKWKFLIKINMVIRLKILIAILKTLVLPMAYSNMRDYFFFSCKRSRKVLKNRKFMLISKMK